NVIARHTLCSLPPVRSWMHLACRKLRIRDRAVETAMLNESAPGEKLLTKGEVAQLCRVEIRTVDRWVAAGKIRCYRIPSGRLLFRKRDVLKRDVLMAADRRDGRVVQTGR